jgi:REP element-mobilizing transposase RayT
MPYNLPQRKSPRATWHDYNGGRYFVTFCTKNHELYFGDVVDGRMELSEIGKYALQCIGKIPEINDNVAVPEFVVMPNHVHMIVIIDNPIEWPDDKQLSQFDQRLPQWDSPTAQNGNMMHESGTVGLSYHGSRWDESTIDDFQQDINEEMQRRSNCSGRLSRIIGQYKSAVTKYANEHDISFAWQPRFHDHIIRNWTEMNHIAQYIQHNPEKWELDRFYKKR